MTTDNGTQFTSSRFLETLGRLEALEAQLDEIGLPAELAGIDRDDLRELGGDEAVRDLDRLDEAEPRALGPSGGGRLLPGHAAAQ